MKELLTVLLPVYNGEDYIEEAILSILNQTFENFKLLIVNDGSTDNTTNIISKYKNTDSRIQVVERQNKGLIYSLNEGLSLSTTDLVARMDADDISFPLRLEKQFNFMSQHPEISVCGAAIQIYETGTNEFLPKHTDELLALSLFSVPVFHPTVMMRRQDVLSVGGYSPEALCAEDYDLWERMLYKGFRFSNIEEVLLKYRSHPNKKREVYHAQMHDTAMQICIRQLKRLHLDVNQRNLFLHRICWDPQKEPAVIVNSAVKWLSKIEHNNKIYKYINEHALANELEKRKSSFKTINFLKEPTIWMTRIIRHIAYSLLFAAGKNSFRYEARLKKIWHHFRSNK